MALSLANMLDRVKRNVPTTVMDTELQDSLLERMNYLVSADVFPFQEDYEEDDITSGYRMVMPDNFASLKDVVIWTSGKESQIEIIDSGMFDRMFPKPDEDDGTPKFCCVKVAEGELWFNCSVDQTYTIRMYFYKIPDDATDTTVNQLVELAKLTLIKWASADGFRMMREFDTANQWQEEGNKHFQALERRYQLAREEGARFISFREVHLRRRAR